MEAALDACIEPSESQEKIPLRLIDLGCDPSDLTMKIAQQRRQALALLVEAYEYAIRFNRDVEDFPVEVGELKAAGLTGNDLRGLLYAGLLEHASRALAAYKLRGDRPPKHFDAFDEKTGFALTRAGLIFARHALAGAATAAAAPQPEAPLDAHQPQAAMPAWNVERRELYLGTALVKRFKVPAINQVRILSAFEEERWPMRVDDPLPMQQGIDPKRRLHDTINSLNRSQLTPLLRFAGDGTGTGIRWGLSNEAAAEKVANGPMASWL
jgi:hypothetical protein